MAHRPAFCQDAAHFLAGADETTVVVEVTGCGADDMEISCAIEIFRIYPLVDIQKAMGNHHP